MNRHFDPLDPLDDLLRRVGVDPGSGTGLLLGGLCLFTAVVCLLLLAVVAMKLLGLLAVVAMKLLGL